MTERPAKPSGTNTMLDMVNAGKLAKDPRAKIDPVIYDPETNLPIVMGNTDPNVIGADDQPKLFAYRGPNSYPSVPTPVKDAEIKFIFPMAQFLANTMDITVLDETAYEKVLPALRCRALFVVLNLHKCKIEEGTASWFGLMLLCKKHVVAMVRFKLRLSTGQIGIDQVRLWDKSNNQYVMHTGVGGKFLNREETSALLLNYLRNENILPGI